MISDSDLHRLAMFLGSCAMMMVVLYHFLEVNAKSDVESENVSVAASKKGSGEAKSASVASGNAAGATSRKGR